VVFDIVMFDALYLAGLRYDFAGLVSLSHCDAPPRTGEFRYSGDFKRIAAQRDVDCRFPITGSLLWLRFNEFRVRK
jgi:hypothetical protein